MNKYGVLALGAALALPLLAQGKLALPNETFGRIEASFDVCLQVDSKSASKYQEAKKALTQGATDEEVAKARASKEYKTGYSETSDEMSKQPPADVAKTCAAALEGKK
ncbi:MAG TPA: hypothetical protein VJP02_30795 [Candidatus Sulfotelmatobacter sp.]|nr:hypothetical protein [Candidatus Sulfotelmatobacter sp.]